ncbi:NAD(+) diphosphatase [Clostridiaceae bacterium M8S5]|nr:NAD(+) diphosphatase [Clostridiaceae bacterium M8S5]
MNDTNINKCKTNSCCFLFNKRNIILKEHENCLEFLTTSEAEKYGIGNEMIYIGKVDGIDYYAAHILTKDKIQGHFLKGLEEIYGDVDEDVYFLTLRALHFINWLNKTKYCSCCGEKVKIEPKKTCIECSNCGNVMYSFINPCIIVAVLKEDKILLARSSHFTPNMYSLISGFVEAGEYIETSVEREVKEEVGIEIKNIKYIGSHPWPFSNSLMFGFIAEYSSGEITIDNDEIEDANWYSLDDLPNVPAYKLSFARKIIEYIIKIKKE